MFNLGFSEEFQYTLTYFCAFAILCEIHNESHRNLHLMAVIRCLHNVITCLVANTTFSKLVTTHYTYKEKTCKHSRALKMLLATKHVSSTLQN